MGGELIVRDILVTEEVIIILGFSDEIFYRHLSWTTNLVQHACQLWLLKSSIVGRQLLCKCLDDCTCWGMNESHCFCIGALCGQLCGLGGGESSLWAPICFFSVLVKLGVNTHIVLIGYYEYPACEVKMLMPCFA